MKQVMTIRAGLMGIALAVFLAPAAAQAEIEVLESSAPGIAAGAKLSDEAPVNVPQGASIRVLILSSGSTKTVKGPYQGTVGDYKDNRNWWERITGREKDSDAPIGATRGMRPPAE